MLNTRYAPLGCSLATLALLTACSSAKPAARADREDAPGEDAEALLEREVKLDPKQAARAQAEVAFTLPKPPPDPAISVDGKFDDWQASDLRSFQGKPLLEDGPSFWRGDADLSFKVGVKADAAFVYFWIEVRDDVVIRQDDARGKPVDAVTVWLRDPGLSTLKDVLPEGVRVDSGLVTDLALVISPTGRVRRGDERAGGLPSGVVYAEAFDTPTGYGVELAVRAELFPQVSTFPLQELAFRVDVSDGDEPERLGVQTRMSMLPQRGADAPRFAIYHTPGLLPHLETSGDAPPRAKSLGFWVRGDASWSFSSYEVTPKHWRFMHDMKDFGAQLQRVDALQEVCNAARTDRALLEAYQSSSGNHRVGLVTCASREVDDTCPDDAQTHVYWVYMQQQDGQWRVRQHLPVFPEPLPQCSNSAPDQGPVLSRFTIFPLDFIDPATWAVGWYKRHEVSDYLEEAEEVAILHVKRPNNPMSARLAAYRIVADGEERTEQTSRIYFTPVDEVEGVDICQLERIHEQSCARFNTQCKTRPHGRDMLTHTKLWEPRAQRFEHYELSKHPNCRGDLDFTKRDAYMLVHIGQRIGLMTASGY